MLPKEKRAVLFTNGFAESPALLALRNDDYLIAVDGGTRYLKALGLKPHLLIGDLDSIDPLYLQSLEQDKVEILRFKPEKDFTDLELALREAIARGYRQIVIAFGLGGRLDHLLGNLSLLSLVKELSRDVQLSFDDGLTRACLVDTDLGLEVGVGDIISLIPWRGDVVVEETQGLAYPLHHETLFFGGTRGNSNLALADTILVKVAQGELVLVHTRKQ